MKIKTLIIQLIINLFFGIIITLMVRHYLFYQNIALDIDAWGVFYSAFGILYAIMIGFILIGALDKYEQLKLTVDSEISEIQNIRDFLIYFDEKQKEEINNVRKSLYSYVTSIIEKEWKEMSDLSVQTSIESSDELKQIIVSVGELKVENENDSIALNSIINLIPNLTNHRIKRIYLSDEEVPPPVMKLLIFMSIILVAGFLVLGVQGVLVHIFMICSLSTTIQFVINLLFDLNNPFDGIWYINNKNYVDLSLRIKNKIL